MISITIPIKPFGQQRPRFSTRNGFAHAYKSPVQREREKELQVLLKSFVPSTPYSGELQLDIQAEFEPPKSLSKKKKAAMIESHAWHTSKPDCTNIAKAVEDVMTDMGFWDDDSLIAKISISKCYGERDCLKIILDAIRKEQNV